MSTTPRSLDTNILRAVAAREPAAMQVFFEHFYDRVFRYVVTLVRDRTTAEDLAQDAFLRMHQALDRLDPGRDPSPWVFTVVSNAVRDHWRRRARQGNSSVDIDQLWQEPAADIGERVDERLQRQEDEQTIHRALGELSPADREVILLRTFERMNSATVGDALGITPEAARQRYSRAVRRLGTEYKKLMGEGPIRP